MLGEKMKEKGKTVRPYVNNSRVLWAVLYGWCYLSDRGPTNNLTNNLLFVVLANIHFDKIRLEQIYVLRRLRAQKGNQTNS